MHKLRSVALVLKSVIKEGVAHANHALLGAAIKLVSELFEPHPVIGVARLSDLVF